jgi:nucleoside-diphosphate kinase
MEQTLVLIKPDGVQRGLVGKSVMRFEERGLKIVGLKFIQVDRSVAEKHYAVHASKPFYQELVNYISSGPVVALALEGHEAVSIVRKMIGSTRSSESSSGTVRGDFGLTRLQNTIHASDSPETAVYEISVWFSQAELLSYRRDVDCWIVDVQEKLTSPIG